MHGGLIHNATDVATSGLLKSFAAPFFTDDQRLDTLFLSTLSRYPTDAEREMMLETSYGGNDGSRASTGAGRHTLGAAQQRRVYI